MHFIRVGFVGGRAPAAVILGILVAGLSALSTTVLHAGVTSVVSLVPNQNDALLIPAPTAVTPEALTFNPANGHNCAFVFEEAKDVVLPVDLHVDVADTLANIPSAFNWFTGITPLTGDVIPAGTKVNSVYVHFDTPLTSFGIADFAVHLDENILGVIMTDQLLDDSDPILGAGGTLYPTGLDFRGTIFDTLEALGAEGVIIGVPGDGLGPSRDIIFRMEAEAVLDGVRIITQPVPEPASWALCAITLLATVRFRERVRK